MDSVKHWGLMTLLLPTQFPISIINCCIDYNSPYTIYFYSICIARMDKTKMLMIFLLRYLLLVTVGCRMWVFFIGVDLLLMRACL